MHQNHNDFTLYFLIMNSGRWSRRFSSLLLRIMKPKTNNALSGPSIFYAFLSLILIVFLLYNISYEHVLFVQDTENVFFFDFHDNGFSTSAKSTKHLQKKPVGRHVRIEDWMVSCSHIEDMIQEYKIPAELMELSSSTPLQLKSVADNETSTWKEMDNRRNTMNSGCILDDFYRKKAHMSADFEELLELQLSVQKQSIKKLSTKNNQYVNQKRHKASHVPNGWDKVRSIFMLDKSSLLTCLPLKTGTTNWQKTLASIMVYESTGQFLDPISISDVFDDVPRYYANFDRHIFNPNENPKYSNVSTCIKKGLELRARSNELTRMINVRHPFSRLLSAWRNKFAISFPYSWKYMQRFGAEIKVNCHLSIFY